MEPAAAAAAAAVPGPPSSPPRKRSPPPDDIGMMVAQTAGDLPRGKRARASAPMSTGDLGAGPGAVTPAGTAFLAPAVAGILDLQVAGRVAGPTRHSLVPVFDAILRHLCPPGDLPDDDTFDVVHIARHPAVAADVLLLAGSRVVFLPDDAAGQTGPPLARVALHAPVHFVPGPGGHPRAVCCLSPDSNTLFVADVEGGLHAIDLSERRLLSSRPPREAGPIASLHFLSPTALLALISSPEAVQACFLLMPDTASPLASALEHASEARFTLLHVPATLPLAAAILPLGMHEDGARLVLNQHPTAPGLLTWWTLPSAGEMAATLAATPAPMSLLRPRLVAEQFADPSAPGEWPPGTGPPPAGPLSPYQAVPVGEAAQPTALHRAPTGWLAVSSCGLFVAAAIAPSRAADTTYMGFWCTITGTMLSGWGALGLGDWSLLPGGFLLGISRGGGQATGMVLDRLPPAGGAVGSVWRMRLAQGPGVEPRLGGFLCPGGRALPGILPGLWPDMGPLAGDPGGVFDPGAPCGDFHLFPYALACCRGCGRSAPAASPRPGMSLPPPLPRIRLIQAGPAGLPGADMVPVRALQLCSVAESSPEQEYERHLAAGNFLEALDLADRYRLSRSRVVVARFRATTAALAAGCPGDPDSRGSLAQTAGLLEDLAALASAERVARLALAVPLASSTLVRAVLCYARDRVEGQLAAELPADIQADDRRPGHLGPSPFSRDPGPRSFDWLLGRPCGCGHPAGRTRPAKPGGLVRGLLQGGATWLGLQAATKTGDACPSCGQQPGPEAAGLRQVLAAISAQPPTASDDEGQDDGDHDAEIPSGAADGPMRGQSPADEHANGHEDPPQGGCLASGASVFRLPRRQPSAEVLLAHLDAALFRLGSFELCRHALAACASGDGGASLAELQAALHPRGSADAQAWAWFRGRSVTQILDHLLKGVVRPVDPLSVRADHSAVLLEAAMLLWSRHVAADRALAPRVFDILARFPAATDVAGLRAAGAGGPAVHDPGALAAWFGADVLPALLDFDLRWPAPGPAVPMPDGGHDSDHEDPPAAGVLPVGRDATFDLMDLRAGPESGLLARFESWVLCWAGELACPEAALTLLRCVDFTAAGQAAAAAAAGATAGPAPASSRLTQTLQDLGSRGLLALTGASGTVHLASLLLGHEGAGVGGPASVGPAAAGATHLALRCLRGRQARLARLRACRKRATELQALRRRVEGFGLPGSGSGGGSWPPGLANLRSFCRLSAAGLARLLADLLLSAGRPATPERLADLGDLLQQLAQWRCVPVADLLAAVCLEPGDPSSGGVMPHSLRPPGRPDVERLVLPLEAGLALGERFLGQAVSPAPGDCLAETVRLRLLLAAVLAQEGEDGPWPEALDQAVRRALRGAASQVMRIECQRRQRHEWLARPADPAALDTGRFLRAASDSEDSDSDWAFSPSDESPESEDSEAPEGSGHLLQSEHLTELALGLPAGVLHPVTCPRVDALYLRLLGALADQARLATAAALLRKHVPSLAGGAVCVEMGGLDPGRVVRLAGRIAASQVGPGSTADLWARLSDAFTFCRTLAVWPGPDGAATEALARPSADGDPGVWAGLVQAQAAGLVDAAYRRLRANATVSGILPQVEATLAEAVCAILRHPARGAVIDTGPQAGTRGRLLRLAARRADHQHLLAWLAGQLRVTLAVPDLVHLLPMPMAGTTPGSCAPDADSEHGPGNGPAAPMLHDLEGTWFVLELVDASGAGLSAVALSVLARARLLGACAVAVAGQLRRTEAAMLQAMQPPADPLPQPDGLADVLWADAPAGLAEWGDQHRRLGAARAGARAWAASRRLLLDFGIVSLAPAPFGEQMPPEALLDRFLHECRQRRHLRPEDLLVAERDFWAGVAAATGARAWASQASPKTVGDVGLLGALLPRSRLAPEDPITGRYLAQALGLPDAALHERLLLGGLLLPDPEAAASLVALSQQPIFADRSDEMLPVVGATPATALAAAAHAVTGSPGLMARPAVVDVALGLVVRAAATAIPIGCPVAGAHDACPAGAEPRGHLGRAALGGPHACAGLPASDLSVALATMRVLHFQSQCLAASSAGVAFSRSTIGLEDSPTDWSVPAWASLLDSVTAPTGQSSGSRSAEHLARYTHAIGLGTGPHLGTGPEHGLVLDAGEVGQRGAAVARYLLSAEARPIEDPLPGARPSLRALAGEVCTAAVVAAAAAATAVPTTTRTSVGIDGIPRDPLDPVDSLGSASARQTDAQRIVAHCHALSGLQQLLALLTEAQHIWLAWRLGHMVAAALAHLPGEWEMAQPVAVVVAAAAAAAGRALPPAAPSPLARLGRELAALHQRSIQLSDALVSELLAVEGPGAPEGMGPSAAGRLDLLSLLAFTRTGGHSAAVIDMLDAARRLPSRHFQLTWLMQYQSFLQRLIRTPVRPVGALQPDTGRHAAPVALASSPKKRSPSTMRHSPPAVRRPSVSAAAEQALDPPKPGLIQPTTPRSSPIQDLAALAAPPAGLLGLVAPGTACLSVAIEGQHARPGTSAAACLLDRRLVDPAAPGLARWRAWLAGWFDWQHRQQQQQQQQHDSSQTPSPGFDLWTAPDFQGERFADPEAGAYRLDLARTLVLQGAPLGAGFQYLEQMLLLEGQPPPPPREVAELAACALVHRLRTAPVHDLREDVRVGRMVALLVGQPSVAAPLARALSQLTSALYQGLSGREYDRLEMMLSAAERLAIGCWPAQRTALLAERAAAAAAPGPGPGEHGPRGPAVDCLASLAAAGQGVTVLQALRGWRAHCRRAVAAAAGHFSLPGESPTGAKPGLRGSVPESWDLCLFLFSRDPLACLRRALADGSSLMAGSDVAEHFATLGPTIRQACVHTLQGLLAGTLPAAGEFRPPGVSSSVPDDMGPLSPGLASRLVAAAVGFAPLAALPEAAVLSLAVELERGRISLAPGGGARAARRLERSLLASGLARLEALAPERAVALNVLCACWAPLSALRARLYRRALRLAGAVAAPSFLPDAGPDTAASLGVKRPSPLSQGAGGGSVALDGPPRPGAWFGLLSQSTGRAAAAAQQAKIRAPAILHHLRRTLVRVRGELRLARLGLGDFRKFVRHHPDAGPRTGAPANIGPVLAEGDLFPSPGPRADDDIRQLLAALHRAFAESLLLLGSATAPSCRGDPAATSGALSFDFERLVSRLARHHGIDLPGFRVELLGRWVREPVATVDGLSPSQLLGLAVAAFDRPPAVGLVEVATEAAHLRRLVFLVTTMYRSPGAAIGVLCAAAGDLLAGGPGMGVAPISASGAAGATSAPLQARALLALCLSWRLVPESRVAGPSPGRLLAALRLALGSADMTMSRWLRPGQAPPSRSARVALARRVWSQHQEGDIESAELVARLLADALAASPGRGGGPADGMLSAEEEDMAGGPGRAGRFTLLTLLTDSLLLLAVSGRPDLPVAVAHSFGHLWTDFPSVRDRLMTTIQSALLPEGPGIGAFLLGRWPAAGAPVAGALAFGQDSPPARGLLGAGFLALSGPGITHGDSPPGSLAAFLGSHLNGTGGPGIWTLIHALIQGAAPMDSLALLGFQSSTELLLLTVALATGRYVSLPGFVAGVRSTAGTSGDRLVRRAVRLLGVSGHTAAAFSTLIEARHYDGCLWLAGALRSIAGDRLLEFIAGNRTGAHPSVGMADTPEEVLEHILAACGIGTP
ncbi:hypothetical protein H696_01772 [Fonticula alba]|uniref:Uncharacterized protein n=1 Tax=Fonticula alba TaxID=691883 RepID=A0A058ZEK0_FONAL|nr:hypothetical protein H696_01772 [Fonticula alba]KCV72376.1 hypothetical protein H696_01772 [Fonticula alba]|eukprot:XP_009493954.1 hypothetical protein H696_01772 [Fonticula alba]